MIDAQTIAETLGGRRSGKNYRCPCPAHGGQDNNLVISDSPNGNVLFHCFSHQCEFVDIVSALKRLGLDTGKKEFIPRSRAYPELESDYLVIEIWEAGHKLTKADEARLELALMRTGATTRALKPPYAKRLKDPDQVYLWYGLGAWEKAVNRPTESLVLPPSDDPYNYDWPVKNRAVILIACGKMPNIYRLRVERCIKEVAQLMVSGVNYDG